MLKYRIVSSIVILLFYINNIALAKVEAPRNVILGSNPIHLPELEFIDSDGNKRKFEEFEGNVLLVHFWATWCGQCVSEMVDLNRLQKEFKKLPFKVITISEDFKGIKIVQQFFEHHGINNLDIYLDQKTALFNEFKIIGLPTTIIFDHEYNQIMRFNGPVKWQSKKEELLKYINNVKP